MSDFALPLLVVGLTSLAAACLASTPFLIHMILPRGRLATDESWRDEAPRLFRWSRRYLRRFVHYKDDNLSDKKRATLNVRLNEAGYGYAIEPAEVEVVRWVVVVMTVTMVFYLTVTYSLYSLDFLLPAVAFAGVSYFGVDFWLKDEAKRRKLSIEKQFPFFLDVVVLSMKAGLAFPAAIQQATARLPNGPIKYELARLIREVRTGVSRSDGLERLAKRVRLASVSNFVAAVAQADESGGSLTASLNEQAKQRRRERFQRAEKLANQAPVKMLFPLVAFLFPVTFMIIGFPIYQQLSKSGLF